jgi:hypothetical protein
MLPYANPPENVFSGSEDRMDELLQKIRSAQGQ